MAGSGIPFAVLPRLLAWIDNVQMRFGNVVIWYRGQTAQHALRPRLFAANPLAENQLNQHFMRHAPAVHENCPSSREYAKWLSLMQHHGLPTRLLDWTSSPLVAAYNACKPESEQEKSSYIWALAPGRLNYQMKLESDRYNTPIEMGEGGHLFSLDDSTISDRVENAFANQVWRDRIPVAVYSPHLNSRMANQHAFFTLHDGKLGLNERFADQKSQAQLLDKFPVRGSEMQTLQVELDRLQVNEASLYPDLDHLAKHLNAKYWKSSASG